MYTSVDIIGRIAQAKWGLCCGFVTICYLPYFIRNGQDYGEKLLKSFFSVIMNVEILDRVINPINETIFSE